MELARLYRDAQRSFVELAESLTDDDWARNVPCNPDWTVRDVLSHVAGVSIDISEGNVEGAATDPWTAVQVERWRDTPHSDLIARWNAVIDPVAEGVQAVDEPRPALDCHSHEHDVRHAVNRPGNRDSELIGWMAKLFDMPVGRPVEIGFSDGGQLSINGVGELLRVTGVTRFEFVRSRLGRRSRAQVATFEWSRAPTETELDEWFVFGPSTVDIVE